MKILRLLPILLLTGCIAPPGTWVLPEPTPAPTMAPPAGPGRFARPVLGPLSKVSTLAQQDLGLASDLAMDSEGRIWLSSDHRILRLTPGRPAETIAGGAAGDLDGRLAQARFSSPWGLAFDSRGNLYVADSGNHRIRKITPGGEVSTLTGGSPGYLDGPLALARLVNPKGLAIDSEDNLYVSEGSTNAYHIRKITPAGQVLTLAGGAEGQADGPGATAAFLRPEGLDVDRAGAVFVVDAGNHRIRRVSPDGYVSTFAGDSQGSADGEGRAARFNRPADLAIDQRTGYVYVTEFEGNRIRQITPAGRVSTLIGGSGKTDGALSRASLSGPLGMLISPEGALFFADSLNHSVRMID